MAFKVISNNFNTKRRIYFDRVAGKYHLEEWGTFTRKKDYEIMENISAIEPITEENKSSFIGKAGWGIAGSVLLGPVGLLAGVLAGGNKKAMTCAIEIYPEYKMVAEIDVKAYHDLNAFAATNRANGKILSDSDLLKPEPAVQNTNTGNITLDDLPKLKQLLDAGVISQEEFDAAKKKVLG